MVGSNASVLYVRHPALQPKCSFQAAIKAKAYQDLARSLNPTRAAGCWQNSGHGEVLRLHRLMTPEPLQSSASRAAAPFQFKQLSCLMNCVNPQTSYGLLDRFGVDLNPNACHSLESVVAPKPQRSYELQNKTGVQYRIGSGHCPTAVGSGWARAFVEPTFGAVLNAFVLFAACSGQKHVQGGRNP